MVVIVQAAGSCAARVEAALSARAIAADVQSEAGRHVVLAGPGVRHRLLIVSCASAPRDGYLVPHDGLLSVRLAALTAFAADPRSPDTSAARAVLTPSHYQRRRLALLLAILDRQQAGSGEPATIRHVAQDLIYPGLVSGRAIDWKSSSHRRQAQRLLAAARRMMASGYRDLLKASTGPGQANPDEPRRGGDGKP